MANTSGALGFVQGLQGGMEFADTRRRNKAIDNMLDQKKYLTELDIADRKEQWVGAGHDLSEFPEFENPTEKDPLLVRGFNFLKGKFGFGSKNEGAEPPAGLTEEVRPTQDEGAVTGERGMGKVDTGAKWGFRGQDGAVQQLADGGSVDEERMKRSYGDYYVTEDEAEETRRYRESLPPGYQSPTSPYMSSRRDKLTPGKKAIPTFTGTGPGLDMADIREVAGDVGRAIPGVFDDTIKGADTTEAYAEIDKFNKAEGARAKGDAARGVIAETGEQMGSTVLGLGKDIADASGISKGLDFVLGFVGPDGKRDNRQADPSTPPKGMTAKDDTPKAQAIEASVGGEEDSANVAKKAVDAAVEMTPGHPDNPDQAFDWSEVAATGIKPEDIPSAPVADWEKYRKAAFRGAILSGKDPQQRMMDITKMQMDGFAANMQQASFLAKQGDWRGAALAARMAYQYFPNGSDVRFGIAEGKSGPVLVAMGYDEKTGEPVGEGTPQVLTADTFAMYAASAKDPNQWLTWTKDWHQMAKEDREYNEITVPKEQAELELTGARTDYYRSGADANRAAAAGGGANPLKQSDYDRAYKEFVGSQELRSLEDEGEAQYLADIMARIYQMKPGTPYPSIINFVMSEHRNGTLEEGLAEIGLR